jgi:uncharacterized protein YjbI with pentapeptide repeats
MIIYNNAEPPEIIWKSPRRTLVGADLHNAKLDGAMLRGIDMRFANLYGASMIGADLRFAKLDEANLITAKLGGALLEGASFVKAKLSCADLCAAVVASTTDFSDADLRSADLRAVDMDLPILKGALRDRKGDEEIEVDPPEAADHSLDPVGGSDDLGSPEDIGSLAYVEEAIAEAEQTRLETKDSNVFVASFPYAQREGLRAYLKSRGLWREPN